jgi:hypothetical protein
MSHQSRNQRTLPPFNKITTHCRRTVLGIISPLIAMTVAGMPATAEDLRVIGLADAQAHCTSFEIIANPNNCPVQFLPDHPGFASFAVNVDCTQQPHLSHNIVTVRAFNKMLLNEPWVVAQAIVLGSGVQIRQQPTLGSRHLTITFDVDARGGVNEIAAWAFLKVSASASLPATVTKPICPSTSIIVPHGTAHQFSCSSDADCDANNVCQMPCGFCDRSPFTEPPMARTVTVAEMRDLGFGVEPRTGNEHATFRVIWEDVSVDDPLRQCPVSFDNGRTPTESVAAVLNCTTRLSKAQASFDMFNEIKLNPPWVVDVATVTEFQATTANSTTTLTKPAAGDNTLTTRVRLKAKAHEQTRAAVSIRIKPAFLDPLPKCIQSGPSFCTTVTGCPSNAICRAACGSRCVLP